MKSSRHKHVTQIIQTGIYPSLPKVETWICFIVWTYGVVRSVYTAYRSASDYRPYFLNRDFVQGWSVFNREKDVTDYEWTVWGAKFISLIPWYFVHITVTQLLWWKLPRVIPLFYALFSAANLLGMLGWKPTVFLFLQPLLMFAVHFTRNRIACWIVGLSFLMAVNMPQFAKIRQLIVPIYSENEYVMSVVMAWINTRCLAFCLHRCTEDKKKHLSVIEDFFRFLGYCFYLPLLYTGPLMTFDEFEKQMDQPKPKWTLTRVQDIAVALMRYIFWFLVCEFFVHHVYISSLHMYPHLASQLSSFGLAGLAYGIAQFFMVKYVVLYGLPGTIAKIESYNPPNKPKCVATIHLYSDMWRCFDRGLYTFLKRYIFIPSIGENPGTVRKLFGSAVTFTFIYVWHGTSYYIFLWSLLNYIGVVLEVFGTAVSQSEPFMKFEEAWLTPRWSRRFRALCATPLATMSILSNFYFLTGYEIGSLVVNKLIFHAPLSNLCITLSFVYCLCQVSIEVKNWELRKRQKNKGT